MAKLISVAIIAVIYLFGFATTDNSQQVKLDCDGPDSSDNLLETRTLYEYHYHGASVSAAVGTTDLRNQMDISCDVRIQHTNKCLFLMEPRNCKLIAFQSDDQGKNEKWIQDMDLEAVNQYPVSFTLSTGEIRHVFHDPADPLYSVNIKRGILSAFVLRQTELSYGNSSKVITDVQGICPAEVIVTAKDEATLKKDMRHCAVPSRKDWTFSPYSVFWNMSFIQYVINSTNECHYKSDGKSLQNIKCHERHAIMLESTAKTATAVQTNIDYTMELKDIKKRHKGPEIDLSSLIVSGIVYEYDDTLPPTEAPTNFLPKAVQMISDMVKTSEDQIQLFTIGMFNDLVAWLRTSPDLTQLVGKITECDYMGSACTEHQKDLGISYLQDGLVQCATAACNKAFAKIVEMKLVPKKYVELFLFSWTNTRDIQRENLDNILNICKSTNYRFCWLAFGAIVNKYFKEIQMQNDPELSSDVMEQLSFFSNFARSADSGVLEPEKPFEWKFGDYKVIGNLGEVAQLVNPEVIDQLLTCSKRKGLLPMLRVAAVEAMRKMKLPSSSHASLMELIKDEESPVDVRIAAFDLLMYRSDQVDLSKDIVEFLKSDANPQVKGYIASDLKNIINNYESYSKIYGENLPHRLKLELEVQNFDLESIVVDDNFISNSETEADFEQWNFLPKELQNFGVFIKEDVVFNSLSFFPETMKLNWTMELFSETINLIEFGLKTGGWEGMGLKTHSILKSLQDPNLFQYFSLIMQQLSADPSRKRIQLRPTYVLDKKIEDGVKAIRNLFLENHEQIKPYLMAYVRLFGNDLDFTTLDDVMKYVRKVFQRVSSAQPNSLSGKKTYSLNSTHVLNFVEAYHQFPTMMGLPLNWTTNATLAFSFKSGINSNIQQGQQSGVAHLYFHPSVAATFINRMVLDIPTITKMGVQSNSSLYSSFNTDFEVSNTKNGPFKISLRTHDNTRPLELTRTNYYITGDKTEELQDWDIERKESVECFNEKFERDTGLKVCVDKSYADVTDRVKPWSLMAGSARWKLGIDKIDSDLKSYDMNIKFNTKRKSTTKELDIDLEARGTTQRRLIPIRIKFSPSTAEGSIGISHYDYDDFNFFASRTMNAEDMAGYASMIIVKNEGKEYRIEYDKVHRKEERTDTSMGKNKSPKVDKILAFVDDRKFQIKTPGNEYQITSKIHRNSGNIKADVVFVYNNSNPEVNWMSKILPTIFWENDQKAYLEFRGNWRAPTNPGKETSEQLSTTSINIPYSIIEVVTLATEKSPQSQFQLNITKTERATGKLLTFVNFGHRLWQKESGQVRYMNLTIPRHSWSANILCENDDHQSAFRIDMNTTKMAHKDEADSFFVGWWHPSHSDRFVHKEWNIVYDQKLKHRNGTDDDLRESVRDRLIAEHSSDEFGKLGKKVTVAEIKLTYPFGEGHETVEFDGTFKKLGNKTPGYWSFMKDFVLKSSLQKIQLDSSSTYVRVNRRKAYLIHKSFLTNTETLRNQGNYNLEYIRDSDESCPNLATFKHAISAHWLEFSSQTKMHCKPEKPEAKLIEIDISGHHPYWTELDYQLHQKFDFDRHGGESMNFTSGSMDITVVGDWSPHSYHKKATFQSKTDVLPTSVWELKGEPRGEMDFNIHFPDEEISTLLIHRNLKTVQNKLEYDIWHKHDRNDEQKHHDLSLSLHLNSPHSVSVSGEVFTDKGFGFRKFMKRYAKKICDKLREKLEDPNHEFNVNMIPVLGKTVQGYLDDFKTEVNSRLEAMAEEIIESVKPFEAFYEPTFKILTNTAEAMSKEFEKMDDKFRQTVPGWAWYYLDMPSMIDEIRDSISENIFTWANSYVTGNDTHKGTYKFQQTIPHPFTWKKINQYPTLELNTATQVHVANVFSDIISDSHLKNNRADVLHKVGMLFGPSGVMTFDGVVYEAPKYPKPDCAYLLAQDTRAGTFSVVSKENSIHAIFPEMAVSISGDGTVSFNESKEDHGLPVESYNKDVRVTREGKVIQVVSPGIEIECDTEHFFCIITLQAWFQSGTTGLLGNANGDPKDDFKGPDASVSETSADLMSSFEVSQQPACRKLSPVDHSSKPSKSALKQSSHQLEAAVPFKDCAKIVGFETEPWVEMIAQEPQNNCHSVKALRAFCAKRGLENKKCVSCSDSDSDHKSTIIRSTHTLEVVVLVDQHKSMFQGGKGLALKGLETLVEGVDELFRSNGYSKVSFTLIGFGGKNVHENPSIHTLTKNPWVLEKDVATLLKSLEFNGEDRGNAIEALEYAINVIQFEPSASKVAMLLTVDDEKNYVALRSLHSTQKLLSDSGLTLYTFASFPTVEKGKKVYGLRADGYIFPQSTGSDDYMTYPRSAYAKLTSATRGAIFLRSFVEENTNANFFYGVSEEMFAKVGKETKTCKACRCHRNHMWSQYEACHPAECQP